MKRILIMDDDRQAGDALQEIHAAQGWQAKTAQTPEHAIKRFVRESFDLVISDINLEATQSGLDSPLAALFDGLPTLDELERRYLLHVLQVIGGNKTTTANVIGVDRSTLYRMVGRFGINLTENDSESEVDKE